MSAPALARVASPPAQEPTPPPPGPGRGHKKAEGHNVPTLLLDHAADKKADRLRAILRAPEVIQTAYREGLIGQVDAARLGPKAPTPAERPSIGAPVRGANNSRPRTRGATQPNPQ